MMDCAYLFVCKTQLMFENSLPIAQQLNFVSQNIEVLGQCFHELIKISVYHVAHDLDSK